MGRAADALGEAGLWRLLARGWLLLAAALASCAELGEAAALLVVGAAEALVLVPAYPLLALASPDAGAVAAVFNGAWAVGQGLGPFLTVLPWASVMHAAAAASLAAAAGALATAATAHARCTTAEST